MKTDLKIKKTAQEWIEYHAKMNIYYRVLAWKFEKNSSKNLMLSEEEYINKFVYPGDRWINY